MMHTIVPPELVMPCAQPDFKALPWGKGGTLILSVQGEHRRIERLVCSDPAAYLDARFTPGTDFSQKNA